MSKTTLGCLGGLAFALVVAVIAGLSVAGTFNGLVTLQKEVEARWAQVETVYQRRADLIPNLVATVEGSAAFERGTLNDVVEARARVGQLTVGTDVLENPELFARFQAAQQQLSGALSRLLAVVESYPQLRTTEAFRQLMDQLEGSENRIAVERKRFNEAVRDYNTRLARIPTRWYVSVFGWSFPERPFFAAQPGAETAPQVDFDPG